MSGPELRELLKWPRPLPLEDERVRLLHEVKLGFTDFKSFTSTSRVFLFLCCSYYVKIF